MPQVFADEFKSFPISAELGESLERAHRFAREQAHRLVTLEHLLLALTEDADATTMLAAASVDLGRLSADVSGYLGGLLEDMRGATQTELRPDADLMRVLRAATTAAQQSRRRQIDGAIVLAAMVGDAKSAAAGLLKALGLTFEGAIRALQRTHAQPRVKPAPATRAPGWAPGSTSARAGAVASLDHRAAATAEMAAPQASPDVPLATSAEEFLAAARARIQQRAAAARAGGKAAPAPGTAAAMAAIAAERPSGSSSLPAAGRVDLNPSSLAAAIRDASAEGISASPPTAAAAEPQPAPAGEADTPVTEARAPAESAATMAPAPAPPNPTSSAPAPTNPTPAPEPPAVARLPQAAPSRAVGPLPGRPLRPGDGGVRPPLPAGPQHRPPPGFAPPLRP